MPLIQSKLLRLIPAVVLLLVLSTSGVSAAEKPAKPEKPEKPEKADKPQKETKPEQEAKADLELDYWLTVDAKGVRLRHNSGCRFYGNLKGQYCGKNAGRACRVCGG